MGKKLRDRILAAGLTQKELADRVGVAEKYISYYVNCVKQPSAATLKRMADVLHCTMDDIY